MMELIINIVIGGVAREAARAMPKVSILFLLFSTSHFASLEVKVQSP